MKDTAKPLAPSSHQHCRLILRGDGHINKAKSPREKRLRRKQKPSTLRIDRGWEIFITGIAG